MHDKKPQPAGTAAARAHKTWARKRPSGRRANKAQSLDLVARLIDDPRMRRLTPTGRYAITVAAAKYADRDGTFYVKQETLAGDVGTSRQTINDVFDSAETLGLIEQTHFLRPEQRGQGASNYRFDPMLTADVPGVVNHDTQESPFESPTANHDTRQGVAIHDTRQAVVNLDTVNGSSNENQPNDNPDGDGSTSSKIDDLLAPLPNFKRTADNLALVVEGLDANEPLVYHLRDRAIAASDRPDPSGLFVFKLRQAQFDRWKSRDFRKPATPDVVLASAIKMCSMYEGSALAQEIECWVARGVDEKVLRDRLAS